MKLFKVILNKEDIDTIADSLCEHYNSDISDLPLTDLFILLGKMEQKITLSIGEDEDEDGYCDECGADNDECWCDDHDEDGYCDDHDENGIYKENGFYKEGAECGCGCGCGE